MMHIHIYFTNICSYRDLIYNGQKRRRRAKAINKGFDITWVGGQHTIDRRWLDIP
jgi:hypothetical protein